MLKALLVSCRLCNHLTTLYIYYSIINDCIMYMYGMQQGDWHARPTFKHILDEVLVSDCWHQMRNYIKGRCCWLYLPSYLCDLSARIKLLSQGKDHHMLKKSTRPFEVLYIIHIQGEFMSFMLYHVTLDTWIIIYIMYASCVETKYFDINIFILIRSDDVAYVKLSVQNNIYIWLWY